MPREAADRTTVAIIRHLFAPSAKEPSRSERGTSRKKLSVLRSTVGITMIPSAIPPASVEK